MISHVFGELSLAQVLGDGRGFINFDAELLSFALDDVVQLERQHEPLLPFIDYVKIDVAAPGTVVAAQPRCSARTPTL